MQTNELENKIENTRKNIEKQFFEHVFSTQHWNTFEKLILKHNCNTCFFSLHNRTTHKKQHTQANRATNHRGGARSSDLSNWFYTHMCSICVTLFQKRWICLCVKSVRKIWRSCTPTYDLFCPVGLPVARKSHWLANIVCVDVAMLDGAESIATQVLNSYCYIQAAR